MLDVLSEIEPGKKWGHMIWSSALRAGQIINTGRAGAPKENNTYIVYARRRHDLNLYISAGDQMDAVTSRDVMAREPKERFPSGQSHISCVSQDHGDWSL